VNFWDPLSWALIMSDLRSPGLGSGNPGSRSETIAGAHVVDSDNNLDPPLHAQVEQKQVGHRVIAALLVGHTAGP
jgi:hypothetical protein